MTDQEVMIRFDFIRCALLAGTKPEIIPNEDNVGLIDIAIKALEEIKQYRAIGLTPQMVKDLIKSEKQAHKDAVHNAELLDEYRAIGTPDECRSAVEKQRAKKCNVLGDGYADGHLVYDTYECPNCGRRYEIDYDDYEYCPNCGQHMLIELESDEDAE